MIGTNDMWTTNPELAKLLANPEDGYKYTQCSGKYLDWECPICGTIIHNKQIASVKIQGLSCPICSDGISYPEKLMYNLLQQLNADFEYQKKFDWCKYELDGKQKYGFYDFYIPSKQIIIEMDGGFHSKDNKMNGQTKGKSKQIDNIKDKLAEYHNIKVIRIDCFYEQQNELSKFDYIKNNIINSDFNVISNLSNINWIKINEQSQASFIYNICYYKNKYNLTSAYDLAKKFHCSRSSILNYLKIGTKNNLCNYNPKNESKLCYYYKKNKSTSKRKIICLTTKEIFNSARDAQRKYQCFHISECCNKKRNYAGKLNGYELHWMFYNEYLSNSKEGE